MSIEIIRNIELWLEENNFSPSANIVLVTYMLNYPPNKVDNYQANIPINKEDFNRLRKLAEYSPKVRKGIQILSTVNTSWKNIDKFWFELIEVYNNNSKLSKSLNLENPFNDFLYAITNVKYSNKNHQKKYNERYNIGKIIYKEMNFSGKRLPAKVISY